MRSIPPHASMRVWAPPRSLAATYGIIVIFSSSPYLDVSVQEVPSIHLWIQCMVTGVCPAGFPHSDICGSLCICHSPQLFAAYHVFHRLHVPRHPSCALSDLTVIVIICHKGYRFSGGCLRSASVGVKPTSTGRRTPLWPLPFVIKVRLHPHPLRLFRDASKRGFKP